MKWFQSRHKTNRRAITPELTNALADYQAASQISKRKSLADTHLLAVDFETSGLDAKQDVIISMGFAALEEFSLKLADCQHILVNNQPVLRSENVAIHGIMDDQLQLGVSPEKALLKFLRQTCGKVIVAHYHLIERQFIQALCFRLTGQTLRLNFVDTFWIAKRRMQRRHLAIKPNSLRLFNLRRDYGLPAYSAHNALEDAIATAELLLAEIYASSDNPNTLSLNDIQLLIYNS